MTRNRIETFARELAEDAAVERATLAAATVRARVLGFVVPRHQHAIKRIQDMTEAELREPLGEDDANGHCADRFE